MWNKFRISPTVSKTQSAHNSIYVVQAQHWTPFALNTVGKIAIENGLFYTNTVAEALFLHVNRFHWKRSKFIGFSYHSSNYEIFTYSPIDFNFLFRSSIKRMFVLVCSVSFWLNCVSFQSIPCFHGFSHNIIFTFFVAYQLFSWLIKMDFRFNLNYCIIHKDCQQFFRCITIFSYAK